MTATAEISREVADESKPQLPAGWRWAQLGQVARVFAGSGAPQGKEFFDDDGLPFVRVSDLSIAKRTTSLTDVRDRLSAKALKVCSLVLAKRGTVVFPKSGAAITSNNRAILGIDAYIVGHLLAIEPTDAVISLWLYWSLCQLDMMDYSDNSGYPSLKQSVVEKIEIPLPPLAEQKRIAGILKEQMAAVERARASAEAQLQAAENLPVAYLRAVFDNCESKSWPRKCIGDISSERLIGLVRAFTEQHSSARYPYLKMENITTDGRLVVASRARVSASDDERERYSLQKGDFLFNTRNSFELVGKTAVFDLDEKDWLFNNNLMRVRFKPEIDSFFVLFAFHSDEVASQLESFKSNTTSVCAIYDRQFVEIKIPVPPLAGQRRIAAQLSSQMASAERLRQMLADQLDAINKLPAALLRRAFNGEL
jgi:type I restriction enzyme S subunit